jgi:hypothetical protein
MSPDRDPEDGLEEESRQYQNNQDELDQGEEDPIQEQIARII